MDACACACACASTCCGGEEEGAWCSARPVAAVRLRLCGLAVAVHHVAGSPVAVSMSRTAIRSIRAGKLLERDVLRVVDAAVPVACSAEAEHRLGFRGVSRVRGSSDGAL